MARLREIGRKEARTRFRAKKLFFPPRFAASINPRFLLQSDKLTFTISRVFEGGDASPPTEKKKRTKRAACMDEACRFASSSKKWETRERSGGYLAFEASGTELVITRRAKMTRSYSRRVATRAIFRGKFYRDTITLISFNSAGWMDFSPREGGRGRKIDEN